MTTTETTETRLSYAQGRALHRITVELTGMAEEAERAAATMRAMVAEIAELSKTADREKATRPISIEGISIEQLARYASSEAGGNARRLGNSLMQGLANVDRAAFDFVTAS
jgi:hypothetical protein